MSKAQAKLKAFNKEKEKNRSRFKSLFSYIGILPPPRLFSSSFDLFSSISYLFCSSTSSGCCCIKCSSETAPPEELRAFYRERGEQIFAVSLARFAELEASQKKGIPPPPNSIKFVLFPSSFKPYLKKDPFFMCELFVSLIANNIW